MQITLANTGKRYNREWIFRHVNYTFIPGTSYAITGPNGSGKSTLLQVIAGAVMHSEGEIEYVVNGSLILDKHNNPVSSIQHPVSSIDAFKHISISTPSLEMIEEMTASEFLCFHSTFKTLIKPIDEILGEMTLSDAANKQIRYFSSGMKQRLKLAQSVFSDTPVLLLDEPTTNLDSDGITLYQKLISRYTQKKLLIISSNDQQEYEFCNEIISMRDLK